VPPPPGGPQHVPGFLDYRGGELPGVRRGSVGGGAEEDDVVLLVEGDAPAGTVLHAGKHLLERPALRKNQPQHQRGVSGRRWLGPGLEVSKKHLCVIMASNTTTLCSESHYLAESK